MTLFQSYLFLGLAIVVEVIGTTALKATENFTRLGPSLLTVACYAASFYLLTFSLKVLPTRSGRAWGSC
jgi:small multidrug resistance pump